MREGTPPSRSADCGIRTIRWPAFLPATSVIRTRSQIEIPLSFRASAMLHGDT